MMGQRWRKRLISLLCWVCFSHFQAPLWTCRRANFHQLLHKACCPESPTDKPPEKPGQLLWQGPETKIVLAALPLFTMFKANSKANQQPDICLSCLPAPHTLLDTCILSACVITKYYSLSFLTPENSLMTFLQEGNRKVWEYEVRVQDVSCYDTDCVGARIPSLYKKFHCENDIKKA